MELEEYEGGVLLLRAPLPPRPLALSNPITMRDFVLSFMRLLLLFRPHKLPGVRVTL